jgi:hypothetical protein
LKEAKLNVLLMNILRPDVIGSMIARLSRLGHSPVKASNLSYPEISE